MIVEVHVPAVAILRYTLPDDLSEQEMREFEVRARAEVALVHAEWSGLPESAAASFAAPRISALSRRNTFNGTPKPHTRETPTGAAWVAELTAPLADTAVAS